MEGRAAVVLDSTAGTDSKKESDGVPRMEATWRSRSMGNTGQNRGGAAPRDPKGETMTCERKKEVLLRAPLENKAQELAAHRRSGER